MKILIAYGSKGKFFHLKEFGEALQKLGVEYKLVKDTDYCRGFPSKNIKDWFIGRKSFKKLIKDYNPDVIFVDRQNIFGVESIKTKIPTFVLLRGHFWQEQIWAKKTIYKKPLMRLVLWLRNKIAEKCFENATAIFPICEYLIDIIKIHHPKQNTHVFFEGIDKSKWHHCDGMELKHPCVGLLQDANWWGKTKEMLVLKKVLKELPEINFYWAGDGPYREKIIAELDEFENFNWIGRLEYPDKVRDFLSNIDIYALITGMDLAPLTLKEAQLMEKPVIATDVGGVKEMMVNEKTGFLVRENHPEDIIEKIKFFIKNQEKAMEMGKNGSIFIDETFNWNKIAENFLTIIEKHYIK